MNWLSGTQVQITFDHAIFSNSGAAWPFKIRNAGVWRNSDVPTNIVGNTMRVTFGGGAVAVGDPWIVNLDNATMVWTPNDPPFIPQQGVVAS